MMHWTSPAVCAHASLPDKRLVGRSFSQAATSYDGVAGLQRKVGEELLRQLLTHSTAPATIADVGAGTGHFTHRLLEVFPGSRLIALDLAEGMLRQVRARPNLMERSWLIRGDAESLPFANQSVDVVFSNLALQWCLDPAAVFAEFRRVLRPGGVALFSSFGAQTLTELRQAWQQVDRYSHVNAFHAREELEQALHRTDSGETALWGSTVVLEYRSVEMLMRELKDLGAHNVTANRPRHLTGKGRLRKMIAAYQALMRDGQIKASFEILSGYLRHR